MRRGQKPAPRERQTYCGKCLDGWVSVPDTDPAYLGCTVARPCACNAKGQEQLAAYREDLWRSSWYASGVKAERERRREHMARGLEANPAADDLKRENVRSAFYIPPSARAYLEAVNAKRELANRLWGADAVALWGLDEWASFDALHPDPSKELAAG